MRKEWKRLAGMVLALTMLMGSTVMAAPGGDTYSASEGSKIGACGIYAVPESEISVEEENGQGRATTETPRAYVKSITIYPMFLVPGNLEVQYGLRYYTVNQPGGSFLGLEVTPDIKNALDQAVTDAGYTQVGYWYEVKMQFTGSYTRGQCIFEEPAGLQPISVIPIETYTYSVGKLMDDPGFLLSGIFQYYYNNRQLTMRFNAGCHFAE